MDRLNGWRRLGRRATRFPNVAEFPQHAVVRVYGVSAILTLIVALFAYPNQRAGGESATSNDDLNAAIQLVQRENFKKREPSFRRPSCATPPLLKPTFISA